MSDAQYNLCPKLVVHLIKGRAALLIHFTLVLYLITILTVKTLTRLTEITQNTKYKLSPIEAKDLHVH